MRNSAPVVMASGALRSALEVAAGGDFFGAVQAYALACDWAREMHDDDQTRARMLMDFVHDHIDKLQMDHVTLLRDGGE